MSTRAHPAASNQGLGLPSARVLAVIAAAGLGLGAAGIFLAPANDPARPWLGLLVALAFWLSLGIGATFFVSLAHLANARWSVVIRRQVENWTATVKWLALPLAGLVALSAWIRPGIVWPWMGPDAPLPGGHGTVATAPLLAAKSALLNPEAMLALTLLALGAIVLVAERLRHHSTALDRDGDARHAAACRRLGAAGTVVLAIATTIGALLWFMSLDCHWYSTIYGVWFFSACLWAAIAGIALLLHRATRPGMVLDGIAGGPQSHLLGNMLLAFTLFWAYIAFSQYFVIYNADIPAETRWFAIREFDVVVQPSGAIAQVRNSWWSVSMVLLAGHLLLPFIYLLFRANKQGARLAWAAAACLAMHLADLYWNILPGRLSDDAAPGGFVVRPMSLGLPFLCDLGFLAGIGALCLIVHRRAAARSAGYPLRDPHLQESLDCSC